MWTNFNRLTVNYSKSKLQVIGSKSKLSKISSVRNISANNHIIDRVDCFNYLGITIDPELRFDTALTMAYAKFSHGLYTLSAVRKDLTQYAALTIVKSMLLPYFDYMLFLFSSCTDKVKTKAQRILNRSLRIALRVDQATPVNELYNRAGVMKLDTRFPFNIMKIMHYKVYYTNDLDVIEFKNSAVRTRSGDAPTLRMPFPNNSKFRNSFTYTGHLL